jgi:hypothetical protein
MSPPAVHKICLFRNGRGFSDDDDDDDDDSSSNEFLP